MQCPLNSMHISEVLKFLAKRPNVTTHSIQLAYTFHATHSLIILVQLSIVTSYFDMNSPSVAEYEDEEILKFHLTAK